MLFMKAMLNLVVLRSQNMERLAEFYESLGFKFCKHRHGKGVEHYAAEEGGSVFEIYPLLDAFPTVGVRIGFRVENVPQVYATLLSKGAEIIKSPAPSPWGERAVVKDPDGHIVEILSPNPE